MREENRQDMDNRKEDVSGKAETDSLRSEVSDVQTEKRIKAMKDEYESIMIPENLRQNVLAAIEKGCREADQAAENGAPEILQTPKTGANNKMRRILIRTGQTAAAALLAITVLANSGAGIAYAMERIPVIGAITRVVTFRTYEKQEGKSEAKIEVPQVEAESGSGMDEAAKELNRSVEEYTNQLIAQFEADVKVEKGEGFKAVYTNYEVLTDNESLFTLRINTDEIMASGAQSVRIYNIDKKSDRILTLRDMFPSGTDYVALLSEAAKTKMQEDMKSDSGKLYFLNDGLDSDFKSIKENQNFYINPAGHMVLVFDEYEIAPGYMGVVELEMPESVYKY